MMAHSGYPPPSATQLVAPPAPMGTSASLRGTPAPAMPAFVQAAIVAARIDKSVSTQVTMSAAVGPNPAPSGSAPAPAQPPLVRAALEAARQARSEARTVQNVQASSDRFGLLTSWEQEAELLRSMQLAGEAGVAPPYISTASYAPVPSASMDAASSPAAASTAVVSAAVPVLTSSPIPRMSDVQKIVKDLDGLFEKF